MPDPHRRPAAVSRRALRRTPKARVRVTCRPGVLDLGPNVALSVVDVGEEGILLVAKEALPPGRPVSVGLEGQSHNRPTVRVGQVVSCLPLTDGAHVIDVHFEKALPYQFLIEISREPAPRPQTATGATPGPPAPAAS